MFPSRSASIAKVGSNCPLIYVLTVISCSRKSLPGKTEIIRETFCFAILLVLFCFLIRKCHYSKEQYGMPTMQPKILLLQKSFWTNKESTTTTVTAPKQSICAVRSRYCKCSQSSLYIFSTQQIHFIWHFNNICCPFQIIY